MTDPLSVVLYGCDGSTWDLTDPASPVQLVGGTTGLHFSKVTHRWATTAHRSGRTWKGSIGDVRAFTLTVLIGAAGGAYRTDWRTVDAQFWEALSTDELATLVVNGERSLAFRLDEDNDFEWAQEPGLVGAAQYPIACVADRPEWLGTPVTATWEFQPADTTNYYGGVAGFGPPFYITAASLFDTASVSNPGDLPAFPTWTVTGPSGAARFGVAGSVIQPPFALQSGDVVIVDTAANTITDPSGNSLWPLMGFAPIPFAPIPAGDEVPVAIGMENAGAGASISVSLTPRFRRAWGTQSASALLVPVGGGGGGAVGGSGGLGDMPLGDGRLGDGSPGSGTVTDDGDGTAMSASIVDNGDGTAVAV